MPNIFFYKLFTPTVLALPLKDALSKEEFTRFNSLLAVPFYNKTAHLDNNYALQQVVKKGILSSTKKLLALNNVWNSFDEDDLIGLARRYSNHAGIIRCVEEASLNRFKYYLANAFEADQINAVLIHFKSSKFLNEVAHRDNNIILKMALAKGNHAFVSELLKNNEVYNSCGLNELALALKHSKHPGIVRLLLKNPAIAEEVTDSAEELIAAMNSGDLSKLQCLQGMTFGDNFVVRLESEKEELESQIDGEYYAEDLEIMNEFDLQSAKNRGEEYCGDDEESVSSNDDTCSTVSRHSLFGAKNTKPGTPYPSVKEDERAFTV